MYVCLVFVTKEQKTVCNTNIIDSFIPIFWKLLALLSAALLLKGLSLCNILKSGSDLVRLITITQTGSDASNAILIGALARLQCDFNEIH